jgi:hemoglobin
MQGMRTVFEAAGVMRACTVLPKLGINQVMADDVVSHAFSHGFHSRHVERLAAY